MNIIDKFFGITQNKSTIHTELRAGLVTFLSMLYIIHVHPTIISQAGLSFNACVTSTVLICFFSSLTMSLYAKNPLALAPGLGMNSFFTFTMVQQMNIPFEQALGATFWSGVFFLLLSIFKIRENIIKSVPNSLKKAVAGGIGLFIALIGFRQGEWITSSSETLLKTQSWNIKNIIFIVGVFLTSYLLVKKIKGSFLISIILITALCFLLNPLSPTPLVEFTSFITQPDFSLIGKLDLIHSLQWSLWPILFTLCFVDLFESLGTFMGLLNRFHLTDEKTNTPRRLKESLITDALSTVYSALLGSSSSTVYVESAAGLQEGGRTGLTALVTAFLFLPFMFLSPLISMIPPIATAPILVIIGALMIQPIAEIPWNQMDEALPAFLTFFLIPFTFSITNGLVWGFLSYTFIKICMRKNVHPFLYIISLFCILSIFISY